jgi:formylglycine-generating enzyme required for sulfatase activity
LSDSIAINKAATLDTEGAILVRDALGERRFATPDFPLGFGGAGSQIVLAGRPEGPEAYLGLHEDQLFVQPAENAADVLHNGVRVQRSTWLKHGDVINLGAARLRIGRPEQPGSVAHVVHVDDGSTGNITAPPIITNPPRMQGESEGEADLIAAVSFRSRQAAAPMRRTIRISPARISLGLAALVVAGVLWFIFTATSVGISTNPGATAIKFDGPLPAIPIGGRYMMQPGQYEVTATLAGYSPAKQKIKVTDVPNQRFDLKLVKLPGKLSIELPAPGEVTVDGKALGAAPGPFELTPGTHSVQIAAQRYQLFNGSVEIEGGGKAQSLKPELVPNWSEVSISSEPAGAMVVVDSEERGRTPLTTQIIAGNHSVEVTLAGFKTWKTDVQAKANEPMQLGPIKLGLPDAMLAVRSEPAGASVSVSGVYRGPTPLEIELRPEIAHTVALTKPGYETVTREVKLGTGEQRNLTVPLAGVFGEILVRAQPADAQVFVDGKSVGSANRTVRLIATPHEIEIRKPGFVDYKTTVTPRPGLQQIVETTLLTAEQTRLAATPANVATKANQNQQLKLIPLGRFVMGSARREPGRRANEGQREVEFKRAFYVGTKEVTNADFRKFKAGHRSGIAGNTSLELDNQPVVNVTWEDAAEYCNWLSVQEGLPPAYRKEGETLVAVSPMTKGYRLLTDAEWEWAARYSDGSKLRRYPWGDALPVQPGSGNFADKNANIMIQDVVPDYDDGYPVTAPVGKFPANSLGLFDMGGNVAEWIHDYYTVSSDSQLTLDPMGPAEPPGGSRQHVIRGSSWRQSSVTDLRLTSRDFGDVQRNDLGFRIARYVE